MASRYDSIKTIEELMQDVMIHGLAIDLESKCRVQDIIGRSPVEELVRMANDNGRNDENGNPDPRGSWSSGRKGTSSTFYMVLFQVWNWEDATRFYNQYSNFQIIDQKEELKEAKKRISKLEREHADLEKQERTTKHMLQQEKEKAAKFYEEAMFAKLDLADAQKEITELKAKLYDMMVAQNGSKI